MAFARRSGCSMPRSALPHQARPTGGCREEPFRPRTRDALNGLVRHRDLRSQRELRLPSPRRRRGEGACRTQPALDVIDLRVRYVDVEDCDGYRCPPAGNPCDHQFRHSDPRLFARAHDQSPGHVQPAASQRHPGAAGTRCYLDTSSRVSSGTCSDVVQCSVMGTDRRRRNAAAIKTAVTNQAT